MTSSIRENFRSGRARRFDYPGRGRRPREGQGHHPVPLARVNRSPSLQSDRRHCRANQPARPQRHDRGRSAGDAGRGFAVAARSQIPVGPDGEVDRRDRAAVGEVQSATAATVDAVRRLGSQIFGGRRGRISVARPWSSSTRRRPRSAGRSPRRPLPHNKSPPRSAMSVATPVRSTAGKRSARRITNVSSNLSSLRAVLVKGGSTTTEDADGAAGRASSPACPSGQLSRRMQTNASLADISEGGPGLEACPRTEFGENRHEMSVSRFPIFSAGHAQIPGPALGNICERSDSSASGRDS